MGNDIVIVRILIDTAKESDMEDIDLNKGESKKDFVERVGKILTEKLENVT